MQKSDTPTASSPAAPYQANNKRQRIYKYLFNWLKRTLLLIAIGCLAFVNLRTPFMYGDDWDQKEILSVFLFVLAGIILWSYWDEHIKKH